MPEISADGKTWTIRIRRASISPTIPAFKGQRRELTAADYVYRDEARPRSAGCARTRCRRSTAASSAPSAGREGEGDRASSTTTRRWRACRRSTATRCSSSSTFADYELLSNLTTRRRRAVAREVIEAYGDGERLGDGQSGRHRAVSPQGVAARPADRARGESRLSRRALSGQQPIPPIAQLAKLTRPQASARSPRRDQHHRGIAIRDCSRSSRAARLRRRAGRISSPNVLDAGNRLNAALAKAGVALERGVQPAIAYTYFNMDDPVVGGYTSRTRSRCGARSAWAYNVDEEIRVLRQGQGAARHAARAAEHDRPRSEVRRSVQVRLPGGQGAARQVRLRRPRRRRLARDARRQAARAEDRGSSTSAQDRAVRRTVAAEHDAPSASARRVRQAEVARHC